MLTIEACDLPDQSLLQQLHCDGAYTDAYRCVITLPVSLAAFVQAFYTTRVFKLERMILALCVARSSTDEQARALAAGERDHFAAWTVEARTADQLLMRDFAGRTRSWLMVEPCTDDNASARIGTRLYFGSAVLPVPGRATQTPRMGIAFGTL